MSFLSDEYKALQDKIDKIGAFRFTIKGWSVTVVVAGLVAGAASRDGSPVLIAAVLDACLVFFFLFERQQVRISWKFSERVFEIEREVDRVRRIDRWNSQFSAPRIAGLFFVRNQRSPFKRMLKTLRIEWLWKRLINTTWKPINSRIEAFGFPSLDYQLKLLRKSDGLFYFFLICLAWLPLLIHPSKSGQASSQPQNAQVELHSPAKPESHKASPAISQKPAVKPPIENSKDAKSADQESEATKPVN